MFVYFAALYLFYWKYKIQIWIQINYVQLFVLEYYEFNTLNSIRSIWFTDFWYFSMNMFLI